MSYSEIDVCNQALIICGSAPITDITENTKEARLCNAMYALVRDQFVSAHPWNFAVKRKELNPDASLPTGVWEWTYAYTIPSDVHRLLDIEGSEYSWRKEGNKLYANHTPIGIRYIEKVENIALFPAYALEALAYQLAKTIVYSLTQSAAAKTTMDAEAKEVLRSARSFDAQEGSVRQVEATEWIQVRL